MVAWHTKMPIGSKHHWAYIDAVRRRRRRLALRDDVAFSVTFYPPDDTAVFPRTGSPFAVFNQPVAAGEGAVFLYEAGGAVVETFDVVTGVGSNGGSITFTDDTMTVTPGATLTVGTEYSIIVPDRAVYGTTGGNYFTGVTSTTGWTFTATDEFIALETGDFLLLEDGSKMYLEAHNG